MSLTIGPTKGFGDVAERLNTSICSIPHFGFVIPRPESVRPVRLGPTRPASPRFSQSGNLANRSISIWHIGQSGNLATDPIWRVMHNNTVWQSAQSGQSGRFLSRAVGQMSQSGISKSIGQRVESGRSTKHISLLAGSPTEMIPCWMPGGRHCARLEMMRTSERDGNCQTGFYQPFQSGSRAQSGARLARLPSGTQCAEYRRSLVRTGIDF